MDRMPDKLLAFYERILPEHDVSVVVSELESIAPQILGCRRARVELGPPDTQGSEDARGPSRIPLQAEDGTYVAALTLDRLPQNNVPLFFKMAAWAIRRTNLLRIAQQQNEIVRSLKLARTIVEEALPKQNLRSQGWEISGFLLPAFHVGGDTYAYCPRDRGLCFLLADAVGHGLGSTVLASECRTLWRGVAFERDLGTAVARLNRLLYEDTGPERFVAATLGYCHDDGSVEYVSCGQSPMFLLRQGEVDLLSECDPPLGLFPDLDFRVQRLRLETEDALVCVTDGILEWTDESGEMFSDEGVAAALSGHFESSQAILQAIRDGLRAFHVPRFQRDDACALALLRSGLHLPAKDLSGCSRAP